MIKELKEEQNIHVNFYLYKKNFKINHSEVIFFLSTKKTFIVPINCVEIKKKKKKKKKK